jgi:multisubunit Na+/H+ antiporter MnhB subunit
MFEHFNDYVIGLNVTVITIAVTAMYGWLRKKHKDRAANLLVVFVVIFLLAMTYATTRSTNERLLDKYTSLDTDHVGESITWIMHTNHPSERWPRSAEATSCVSKSV